MRTPKRSKKRSPKRSPKKSLRKMDMLKDFLKDFNQKEKKILMGLYTQCILSGKDLPYLKKCLKKGLSGDNIPSGLKMKLQKKFT